MPSSENSRVDSIEALAAAIAARAGRERFIVAIAGAPGSGKSTASEALREELRERHGSRVQIVPMDGFHYDNAVLSERKLRARKGAPETFDVGSFEHMLMRLNAKPRAEVAVPVFDRAIDLARASARIIPSDTDIILVEGNYLLLRAEPWSRLERYFDLTVMIDCDEGRLRARLMQRWLELNLNEAEATAKVETNDLPNAKRVLAESRPADIAYLCQD